jgi:phosphate starvation-inducible PhoH-like protein
MEINLEIEEEINPLILFGHQDRNLKVLEERLSVNIFHRGHNVSIQGENSEDVQNAASAVKELKKLVKKRKSISEEEIRILTEKIVRKEELDRRLPSSIRVSSGKKFIQLKTYQQQKYVETIHKNDVTYGVGPAGTGKTYIAVAVALSYLLTGKVKKVILTRPVVEAGESLGYLPGTMEEKINPYLKPLMDSIYDMLNLEEMLKFKERGQIEVAPLAYMRGRTLNNAFIILDEAQNTTVSQIKMFLTRIGNDSKVVVTGDITQKDLPPKEKSGLETTMDILKGIPGIDITLFSKKDVVRHPIVVKIIEAFEEYETQK